MADTPRDICSKARVIFTCVTDDTAIDDVLFRKGGVFETITPKNVLVDCSTTSIEMTERMAQECKSQNIAFLDAPLTGSKVGAESGNLVFMVGGRKDVLEDNKPIFEAMGKKIIYCGENTKGQKAKLALNLMQALILEGYAEGMIFALKNDVPLDALLEIIDNSGAKNNLATYKLPFILKRDFHPHFKLDLMKKDLQLASKELERLQLDMPLSKLILNVYKEASAQGLGNEDYVATVKVLEKKAKVTIEKK